VSDHPNEKDKLRKPLLKRPITRHERLNRSNEVNNRDGTRLVTFFNPFCRPWPKIKGAIVFLTIALIAYALYEHMIIKETVANMAVFAFVILLDFAGSTFYILKNRKGYVK
jgi:hypothetical protein